MASVWDLRRSSDRFEADRNGGAVFSREQTGVSVGTGEEAVPPIGEAVFLPHQPVHFWVCGGISSRAVAAGFAAAFDFDDRVRVHMLNPPLRVGVAGMDPGNSSIIHDPEPRAMNGAGRRGLMDDHDLLPNFNQGELCAHQSSDNAGNHRDRSNQFP